MKTDFIFGKICFSFQVISIEIVYTYFPSINIHDTLIIYL